MNTDLEQRLADIGQGERLDREQALDLVSEGSIHQLGAAASGLRDGLYGRSAYYVYNQHLNYTNICKNQCRFCAYSKRRGESGGYTYSIAQVQRMIERRLNEPIHELHIVGGLNPALPYHYYLDLLQMARGVRPGVKIKAFTAVEVAFLADTYGKDQAKVLEDLVRAGLDALPGGGAEVFDPGLRNKLCPEKISGRRWLEIHRLAHEMDLPSNATMLFGHIEGWQERLDHLQALRELQDETHGFMCFIPLPYQPENNRLGGLGPDGRDYLSMIALSRLFLDNIKHLKAYWVMSGIKPAQMALWAGADDFDGTVIEERIGHAAGAKAPKGMTVSELRQTIAAAGFEPVERDTLFRPLAARFKPKGGSGLMASRS